MNIRTPKRHITDWTSVPRRTMKMYGDNDVPYKFYGGFTFPFTGLNSK